MHWLIPAVSHTLSSLLAWRTSTVTPTAVLIGFLCVALQSIHLWPVFYGLISLYFLAGTGAVIVARYDSIKSKVESRDGKPLRTAAHLLANLVVATSLVIAHHSYLKSRLANVPWFHLVRAPAACLPIPSWTLIEPHNYTFLDALGNQLPYAVVVSYAAATAHLFGSVTKSESTNSRLSFFGIALGALGALVVSLTAAYGLPMCGKDLAEGPHQVATHLDRSFDWKERKSMTWSTNARYGVFVMLVTMAGAAGPLLADLLAAALWSNTAKSANSATTVHPPDSKEADSVDEKAGQRSPARSTEVKVSTPDAHSSLRDAASHLPTLCMHILLAGSVVFCMAVWSWTGPRAEQSHEGVLSFLD